MSYCRYNAQEQSFQFEGRAPGNSGPGSVRWAVFGAKTAEEIRRGTGWYAPTDEDMLQWQQQAIALVQRWGHRLSDLEKPLYIRYGNLPKDGRSTNYVTGRKEQGVSVYPAKYDLETGAIVFDDAAGVYNPGTLVFLMDRTPRLVTGQYVGTGSDGEPLLRRVRVRATLRYDAMLKGFVFVE